MKKALYGILVIVILGLGWYLFIKDYNYKIRFETPHAPGTVYSTLLNWDLSKSEAIDSLILIDSEPFETLQYEVQLGDSTFTYNWNIERINDSLSAVTAYVKDNQNSFKQNLLVPFKKTEFVKRNIEMVQNMMNGLHAHANIYKVDMSNVEEVTVESQYCAYITLSSSIYKKGNTMISNIGLIMNYIRDNDIPIKGDPFVQIQDWDIENEKITYDFCFPIEKIENLPPTKTIKFKNTPEFKGLMAKFNGNYRLSDRAWYELLDYADNKNIDLQYRPFEIYRNDPHAGGNEMEWTAEVYMPLK